MILRIIIFNILLPAIISGAGYLFVWLLEKSGKTGFRWIILLAVLLGYGIGYFGIQGFPSLPPGDPSTGWFVYIGAAAFIFAMAELYWKDRNWVVLVGRAILIGFICWFILLPFLRYTWSINEIIVRLISIIVLSLIFLYITDNLRIYSSPTLFYLFLTTFATVESIVIVLSHSIILAQLEGLIAATMGALTVVTWLFPKISTDSDTSFVVSILLIIHILSAVFYADMQIWSAILLASSPAAALVIWEKGSGNKEKVFGFLTALIIQAVVLVLTFITLS